MKITPMLLFLTWMPTLIQAQTTEQKTSPYTYKTGDFFVGFSTGLDFNNQAFQAEPTTDYTFEAKNNRYNISVDAGIMATARLRPRIEFQYHRLAYGQEWNNWQSTSYTTFKYTTVGVNYLALNFRLDYLLLGKDARFKVFVSPGLVSEFASGAGFNTEKTDGTDTSTKYSVLGEYYPKAIAGASLQTLFKYDLSENVGLTLTPGYNAYFRRFAGTNDSPYTRFTLNFGIELRIH